MVQLKTTFECASISKPNINFMKEPELKELKFDYSHSKEDNPFYKSAKEIESKYNESPQLCIDTFKNNPKGEFLFKIIQQMLWVCKPNIEKLESKDYDFIPLVGETI